MIHHTDKVISHKIGLLNLAEQLQNVSQACKVMGFSRDTFYRYKDAVDNGGVDALLETSRRKPNVRNRVDPIVEEAVLKRAIEEPAHGQTRTSNELRKQGVFVSPSGARKTPSTSAHSKVLAGCTNRPMLIPNARWHTRSCTPARNCSRYSNTQLNQFAYLGTRQPPLSPVSHS